MLVGLIKDIFNFPGENIGHSIAVMSVFIAVLSYIISRRSALLAKKSLLLTEKNHDEQHAESVILLNYSAQHQDEKYIWLFMSIKITNMSTLPQSISSLNIMCCCQVSIEMEIDYNLPIIKSCDAPVEFKRVQLLEFPINIQPRQTIQGAVFSRLNRELLGCGRIKYIELCGQTLEKQPISLKSYDLQTDYIYG